jgi:FMN reductase
VTAGLRDPASTRLLADRLSASVESALLRAGRAGEDTVAVEVIDLRLLAHDLANNLLTGFAAGELAEAQAVMAGADGVIAVTPVFSASYSGLFKTFFDVLDEGTLAGVPVLMGATAGTARHSLVLEHSMRPLFAYLKAIVNPTAVFAASEDWGDVRAGSLGERIDRAAGEFANLVLSRPPRVIRDEFTDVVPFQNLLVG